MNKVVLLGRLTRDPEIYNGSNDNIVAKYTLAVDRKYKADNAPTADFIRCITFGRNAEFAEDYLRQGTKISVVGRIQTGSYVNNDGDTVYTTDVVIEEHYFAEGRKEASTEDEDDKDSKPSKPSKSSKPRRNSSRR